MTLRFAGPVTRRLNGKVFPHRMLILVKLIDVFPDDF